MIQIKDIKKMRNYINEQTKQVISDAEFKNWLQYLKNISKQFKNDILINESIFIRDKIYKVQVNINVINEETQTYIIDLDYNSKIKEI